MSLKICAGFLDAIDWDYVRNYIHEKESHREFPLNYISDMELLMHAAGTIVSEFTIDAASGGLSRWIASVSTISTPRLVRLILVILLSAGIEGRVDHNVASSFLREFWHRMKKFPRSDACIAYDDVTLDFQSAPSRESLHLFQMTRELADIVAFGDQTSMGHPPWIIESPSHTNPCVVWCESFFFQPHSCSIFSPISFVLKSEGRLCQNFRVCPFRGKFKSPVPFGSRGSCVVVRDRKQLSPAEVDEALLEMQMTFETQSRSINGGLQEGELLQKKWQAYTRDLTSIAAVPRKYPELDANALIAARKSRLTGVESSFAPEFCNLIEKGASLIS